MASSDHESWAVPVALVVACVALSFSCGWSFGASGVKAAAINAGVAHWRCDPKTGEKHFVWEKPSE